MQVSQTVLTVSDINRYVKKVLTNDENLKYLYVKGELSNVKVSKGHLYFYLKDEESMISGVMFSNYVSKLSFIPKDGDEVTVIASIDVYPARGTYNLMVYAMESVGEGKLLIELEKLKKKLASEGLFDESKKRDINIYPKAIGVITALNGAAVKDIVKNIKRRYPITDIYIFPSQVQGENAPKELLKAFLEAQKYDLDTLIIGRGGGASEDLSAFNDETLVRAIATSKMPVISAVGHEVDITLVDFVADKRASTPTGAAELATADINEIKRKLADVSMDMDDALRKIIDDMQENVADAKDELYSSMTNYLDDLKLHIEHQNDQLNAYNPKEVFKRGYSVAVDDKGNAIKNIKGMKKGAKIRTILSDGELTSIIEEVKGAK